MTKMDQLNDVNVLLRLSLILTILVFFGNYLLHVLATYLYHRFAIFRRLTPKLKPVLSIADSDKMETKT